MPYRLRVTEEEVRQELIKMGFTGLADDTVAAIRKGKMCHSFNFFTRDIRSRQFVLLQEIVIVV